MSDLVKNTDRWFSRTYIIFVSTYVLKPPSPNCSCLHCIFECMIMNAKYFLVHRNFRSILKIGIYSLFAGIYSLSAEPVYCPTGLFQGKAEPPTHASATRKPVFGVFDQIYIYQYFISSLGHCSRIKRNGKTTLLAIDVFYW